MMQNVEEVRSIRQVDIVIVANVSFAAVGKPGLNVGQGLPVDHEVAIGTSTVDAWPDDVVVARRDRLVRNGGKERRERSFGGQGHGRGSSRGPFLVGGQPKRLLPVDTDVGGEHQGVFAVAFL